MIIRDGGGALVLSGPQVRRLLPYPLAVTTLAAAAIRSRDGVIRTPPRTVSRLGEDWSVLMMPASSDDFWGVKVVSVAPSAPSRGRPRIEGAYLLFDAAVNQVACLLDGAALTAIRTAAVSALAASRLIDRSRIRLAVFGTGTQAAAHITAFASLFDLASVHVWGSAPDSAARFLECPGTVPDGVEAGAGGPDRLRKADLVACCTTSRTPLFPASLLTSQCIVAIGSHDPQAQELGADVVGRCSPIVVEDRNRTQREAGEIVQAIADGALQPTDLVDLAALVSGEVAVRQSSPRLFKSVGVGWQDLALALAAYQAAQSLAGDLQPDPTKQDQSRDARRQVGCP